VSLLPSSTKRRHHLPTTPFTCSFAATSLFWLPSAQASTIRALRASALRRLAVHRQGLQFRAFLFANANGSSRRLAIERDSSKFFRFEVLREGCS
jgi:hypothetical protein